MEVCFYVGCRFFVLLKGCRCFLVWNTKKVISVDTLDEGIGKLLFDVFSIAY